MIAKIILTAVVLVPCLYTVRFAYSFNRPMVHYVAMGCALVGGVTIGHVT